MQLTGQISLEWRTQILIYHPHGTLQRHAIKCSEGQGENTNCVSLTNRASWLHGGAEFGVCKHASSLHREEFGFRVLRCISRCPVVHGAMRTEKLYARVAVPSTPLQVSCQCPLALSVTSVG